MNFKLLKSPEQIAGYCEDAIKREAVGFDTETTSLSAHDGEIRLAQIALSEEDVGIIDIKDFPEPSKNPALQSLRDLLESRQTVKVAHNAKFDNSFSALHLGVREIVAPFCTMLGSQLAACGDKRERHNLASVAERYLGNEVDKSEQVSDWSGELSESQLRYAAKDAAVMLPLREKIKEKLDAEDLFEVARIEFGCVAPVSAMEVAGFYLDRERWLEQLSASEVNKKSKAAELQQALSPGVLQTGLFGLVEINLDSKQEIVRALQTMGVPVESVDKRVLNPLYSKYPVLKLVTEYSEFAKATSSYGENILEFINSKTGRIHSSFNQMGADATGRFSSGNPNLQNMPREESIRRCFTAEAGNTLVISDFSQIELRIIAHITEDPLFVEGFKGGRDFHTEMASRVFGVDYDKVTPEQRSNAKWVNFGIAYGMGPQGLAGRLNCTVERAQQILDDYFHAARKLKFWLDAHGKRVLNMGFARTLSGRKSNYRWNADDYGEVASVKRRGNNMPVQGLSADITKRALRRIFDALQGTSGKLVNVIHDEIIVECRESDAAEVASIVETEMIKAGEEYVTRVPILADAKTSFEWKK